MITAPRPGDRPVCTSSRPVLARGTVTGGRETRDADREGRLERRRRSPGSTATSSVRADGQPARGLSCRAGCSRIRRSARRSLDRRRRGRRAAGRPGQVLRHLAGDRAAPAADRAQPGRRRRGRWCCFTPAFGPRTPAVAGAGGGRARSRSRPTAPNVDLSGAVVTAVGVDGGEPIPAGGAVLDGGRRGGREAAGRGAGRHARSHARLDPAADAGTASTAALGGGPLLVRNGKPVFRSLEDFTNDQVARAHAARRRRPARRRAHHPRRGRRRPAGLQRRAHELRARPDDGRGSAPSPRPRLESAADVTAAFDGSCSTARAAGGERPVKEALLVAVLRRLRAAAAPCAPDRRSRARHGEQLSYKIVRPSTGHRAARSAPTARRGCSRPASQHEPGTYSFTVLHVRRRGHVALERPATDDLEPHVDDRPDVPVRHHAPRSRASRGPRRGDRGDRLHPRRVLRSVTLRDRDARAACSFATLPRREPAGRDAQRRRLGRTLAAGRACVRRARMSRTSSSTSSVGTSESVAPFSFRRTG